MAYDLFSVITTWQEIGVFGVLLPFLLIFALSFAILQKTKILGETHKNLNIIVSVVLGLLFLQNIYLVEMVQLFLPKVGIALLFFLMFLLLIGVFTGESVWGADKGWKTTAIILAAIAVIWAATSDYIDDNVLFWLENFLGSLGLSFQALGVILIFILIIVLATRGDDSGKANSGKAKGSS